MNEMVERVARAIAGADRNQWDHMFAPRKAMFVCFARAAMAAMREPTEAMIDSGMNTGYAPACDLEVDAHWRAMIDEALR